MAASPGYGSGEGGRTAARVEARFPSASLRDQHKRKVTMAKITLPDVGEILEAVHSGVERRLGRKRRLFTGEDLIDDVGLSPDQFENLVADLEQRFEVEIDPSTAEQISVAGALVVRLLRLCSQPVDLDTPTCAAA